ncbi:o-methyltransferas-like protein [Hyaloscypha variabilis F]|uniref:O-methyltransferas-like protein n=1 Tax=Hyaloscypha variabilis (strain UAMH 11265 / GT02V1 / F) TaxID=1149755 RepID=A0A2J6R229_HYAVF|nr:o-methyltransferas-like protein [Hyaloscypha variabilis F]
MDKETITRQLAAITQALEDVTKELKVYSSVVQDGTVGKNLEGLGRISESYEDLVASVRSLNRAARGPVDLLLSQVEHIAFIGAVRALLEMGIFDALPPDGSSLSADVLAEKLKVEKDLLIRLMRVATPELFAEVGRHTYAHTPYSLIYLAPPLRSMFKFMLGAGAEYPTVFTQLSEFFKAEGWKSPNSATNNPYTFAHHLSGMTMFDHAKANPEYFSNFNMALSSQGIAILFVVGIFPFREELSKLEPKDDTVLVVDVGGGLGHATKQIKELIGDLKGRVILQDRPIVIEDIKEDLGEIEKMGHDFFTPNPVKGALTYYIRRCLHDWNDETCIEILKNIACSMTAESRLLIAECVLPEQRVNVDASWLDLIMMTFGGRERTEEQWRQIVDAAGLRLEKTYSMSGTHYGVVEAYLK